MPTFPVFGLIEDGPLQVRVTANARKAPPTRNIRSFAQTTKQKQTSTNESKVNEIQLSRLVCAHLEPKHPPSTLAQMTKYLSVLRAAPGPMKGSHHPRLVLSWGEGSGGGGRGEGGRGFNRYNPITTQIWKCDAMCADGLCHDDKVTIIG